MALRQFSRIFNQRSLIAFTKRNYAAERNLDEMNFTFAAANQVITYSWVYYDQVESKIVFQVFYDQKVVKQVDVPSFSGSFGILPRHVPLLAVLKPGVVSVFETDGKVQKIFVSSGTITINDDSSVQVSIYQYLKCIILF